MLTVTRAALSGMKESSLYLLLGDGVMRDSGVLNRSFCILHRYFLQFEALLLQKMI